MVTAAENAYDRIRRGILSGEFPPNSRLKEEELVRCCGVSRTPVREALRRLAAEDFVRIIRNQGAEVRSWSDEDLDDLFELRTLLEGHAARRAAERIDDTGLERISAAVDETEALLAGPEQPEHWVEEFQRLNRIIHETVWHASGSPRLTSMLGHLVEQALMLRTIRHFSLDRASQSNGHHRELLGALTARDPVWAHIRAARITLQTPSTGGRSD